MAEESGAVQMLVGTFGFAKLVSEELGEEKTMDLLNKWISGGAFANFSRKKEELGITGNSLKDVYDTFKAADEEAGCTYVLDEETPNSIKMTIKDCPLIKVCQSTGWDAEEICTKIFKPLATQIPSIINPDITWNVVAFNPDISQGCKYELCYK